MPNAADLLSEGGSYGPDATAETVPGLVSSGYGNASNFIASSAAIDENGSGMLYAEGANSCNHASDANGEDWNEAADGQYVEA